MTRFVGTPLRGTEFSSVSSEAVSARITGDSQPRIRIDAGGRITWSSGSITGDTNLYRGAADTLTTDDVFKATGGIVTLATSGIPTAALDNGAIAIDTTNHVFYFRSNSTWRPVRGSLTVSDSPPTYALEGDMWFESDTGMTFVYYDSFWIEVNNQTGPQGPTGATGPQGPAGATGATGADGGFQTTQTINAQTGTSYILLNSDLGKLVTLNNASAITVTINTSTALSAGQRIDLLQRGAGQVTVVGSGVTINGSPGLKLRGQHSAGTVLCLASNTYVLIGDLAA